MAGGSTGAAVFRAIALGWALVTAACTSVVTDARSLAGTNWRVAALNGTPTPASGFEMSFTADELAAHFGCNRGSGNYRIIGNTMHTGPIAATQMACASATDEGPDPMALERMGFAVISQPMRIEWRSGRELRLTSAAGSIDLQSVP